MTAKKTDNGKKLTKKALKVSKISTKTIRGKKISPLKKPLTVRKLTKPRVISKVKDNPAQPDERKRNMPLVETLDRIEKESAKRKTEQACYIDKKSGECLFCVSGTKNSVTPNDKQVQIIKQKGSKILITHNHPWPYSSSITVQDMQCLLNNNNAGIRAITKKYTYVVISPKDGWKIGWYEFGQIYDKIFKSVEKRYNDLYQDGKMSRQYYEDNLTHEVMEKVSKKLGFIYFRFRN